MTDLKAHDPTLTDSYLWETKMLDPKDANYEFPKPTLAFMIFRTSDCQETIEQLFSEYNKIITILRHHYPFRCDIPRLSINKHKYKKTNGKKNLISYIYCQVTYGDSTNDKNILQDVLFHFCANHSVFAKVYDSSLLQEVFEEYFDDGVNDELLDFMSLENRVWIVGDKVVKLDVPEEDEEDKYADILPLATAVGYMKKNKYTVDTLETSERITRVNFENHPFGDLQYVVEVESVIEEYLLPVYNKNPYLLSTAVTSFFDKDLTLKDTVRLEAKEKDAKPFKFSIGYSSYCEMLALYNQRQEELQNAGKSPNSISFKSAVYQILSKGMTTAIDLDPMLIFEVNQDNLSNSFNSRDKLQDKLISEGYLKDKIPPTTEFQVKDFQNPVLADRNVKPRDHVYHILEDPNLKNSRENSLPISMNTVSAIDYFKNLDKPQPGNVQVPGPQLPENFGAFTPVAKDLYQKYLDKTRGDDPNDPFGHKKQALRRERQQKELLALYRPKDTDRDDTLKVLFKFVSGRKTIADRYNNRSSEYIYFEDMEGLYDQGIYPSADDFYMYYHPEDESEQCYYDPYKLTEDEMSLKYKDVNTYETEDENDDLFRQSHTYEDYNDNEIKYIKLKRKTNNELYRLLG
ncbi:hypothetical protein DFJ63DRAFT_332782 [Scheffersomyces coipomensis]|uniref:uncharacterized protein n=1 Tax=Scheffersomyces coipomensis TaxID=1788519 RepID=UPI00315CB086